MSRFSLQSRLIRCVAVHVSVVLFACSSWAVTGKVLRAFNPGTGDVPIAVPIIDSTGSLYGTLNSDGLFGFGGVYKLLPTPSGPWKINVIYNFQGGTDGGNPYGGLVFDGAGNVYGTTTEGGNNGLGVVFELSPAGAGRWTYKVLYSFKPAPDGFFSMACLTFDAAGNLYGTTFEGGANNLGAVFKLSPDGLGGWTESVIYSFASGSDGSFPFSPVIFDSLGNLYGTTSSGGTNHVGTVFKLAPGGSAWTETILYNFTGLNGDASGPQAGVVFDTAGNLYGTTVSGGLGGQGAAYELSPAVGSWTEKTLHSFRNNGHDGFNPQSTLVIDAAGNLYGTTTNGGTQGKGIVFELSPSGGSFTSKVLRSFAGTSDGSNPLSGVVLDSIGQVYGTTSKGGSSDGGVVYRLTL